MANRLELEHTSSTNACSFRDLASAIDDYSQALLLPFIDAIMTRLPREMRDFIYTCMMDRVAWANFNLTLVGPDKRGPGRPSRSRYVYRPSVRTRPWAWPRQPYHYEDPFFVGPLFANELVETYYRLCIFQVQEYDLPTMFAAWLLKDRFKTGNVAGQHLCRLDVRLTYGGVRLPLGFRAHVSNTMRETAAHADALPQNLAPLLQIRRRCKVRLAFDVCPGLVGLFQFGKLGLVLVPIVDALAANGCVVLVHCHLAESIRGRRGFGGSDGMRSWVVQDSSCDQGLRNATEVRMTGLPCV